MESPFPYSQYVTGKNFVGRKSDVVLLGNLISQGEHVCIYEPPKTGKTSLVQQTLFDMRMRGKSFMVGQFSALSVCTPEDFLLRLGSALVRMTASSPTEYAAVAAKYFKGTHFVYDPHAYAEKGEVLSLNWDLDQEDVAAMLRFPFMLAQDRGTLLFLIVDEFQCINQLDNPDAILRPMDAIMKEQREMGRTQFAYILCGSAVNAMKAIFEGSLLFHRRVERVRLSPLDELEMTDHVHKGFQTSGKVVGKELLQGACHLFKGHPWYMNHFAAICDSMSRGYIMEPVLVDALNCMLAVHEPRFRGWMENLTTFQISLLRATLDGVTRFSASDVIAKYGLHSSANVKRVKDALMKKEVLQFDAADNPTILDPLFEYWLRKYYFEMREGV